MDPMVAGLAQQHAVREIRRTVISTPPSDVMRFRDLGRQRTHGASTIPLDQRQPLRAREQALLPTPIEHFARRTEHAGDHSPACGHPSGRADADRLFDSVDLSGTGAGFQVVEAHPHHDGRTRQRHPGVALENVAREHGESVGLDHRHGATIGVRRVRRGRVLSRGECGGHVAADGRHDRSGGLGVEDGVQMHHPVALMNGQSSPGTLLLQARLHPIRVQPRLGPHDQLAHVVESEPDRLLHQQRLRLGDPHRARRDATPIQQGDDRGSHLSTQRAGPERLTHSRILRRQRRPEEILARRDRFSDLHQPGRIATRDADGRRDQRRRIPVALLLRETLRTQLGTRLA